MKKYEDSKIPINDKYTLYICRQKYKKELSDFVANTYYNHPGCNF